MDMDIYEEQEIPQSDTPVQGKTRFDLWCQHDQQYRFNVQGVIGYLPVVPCPICHLVMKRYYGNANEKILINFGERSTHDEFERFRFRNLATGD